MPTVLGTLAAPTQTAGDNDTSVATTAFVTEAVSTKITGTGVTANRALTQAEYDAIGTKSATTLYFIKAS